jgi:hypothetical protein
MSSTLYLPTSHLRLDGSRAPSLVGPTYNASVRPAIGKQNAFLLPIGRGPRRGCGLTWIGEDHLSGGGGRRIVHSFEIDDQTWPRRLPAELGPRPGARRAHVETGEHRKPSEMIDSIGGR